MRKRVMARGALCFLLFVLLLPGGCRKQEAAAPAGTAESVASTGASIPIPAPQVSPIVPIAVNEPPGTPEQVLPAFDDFSWREFIALTWPARALTVKDEEDGRISSFRGVPDKSLPYDDTSRPLVFLTLKNDYEIFLPNGGDPVKPSAWDSYAGTSPCVNKTYLQPYQTILGSFNKYHGFNEAAMFGSNEGPLIDQNREYVRYQTAVNELEYDYIINPKRPLYLVENLPTSEKDPLNFPTGSIEIKAAWRIMDGVDQARRQRFYITKAQVLDPANGNCTEKEVGLVGLHIVHKTADFTNWVWSTFEQIDNVPERTDTGLDLKGPFSFNNGNPGQQQESSPPDEAIDKCNPPKPLKDRVPTQVVRELRIAESTRKTNDAYHNDPRIKDTVWKNYVLTLTQWPVNKNTQFFPNSTTPAKPWNTANTTMETWYQDPRHTCMYCHQQQPADYDSVWFVPLGAYDKYAEIELCRPVTAFTLATRPPLLAKGPQQPNARTKAIEALRKVFAEKTAAPK